MNGGTDDESGSSYGMAPVALEQAKIEHKPHERGNVVTVLVDNGTSGHYFDDTIIPDLKHRLQDYNALSTPRTILMAGGALLDGTGEGVLQGLITDDYGEQYLTRIAILIELCIGRNMPSEKTAARKDIV